MDTVAGLVAERPVVIFSRSTCPMSHSVKKLIYNYGANPTVYELDEIPNGREIERELVRLGCQPSVPAVFIGQELVGGAQQMISLQISNQLVQLLRRAQAIWV